MDETACRDEAVVDVLSWPRRGDVMPSSSSLKLTYEDYELFPDDGRRHELVDGEHYVTPAPRTRHQRVSIRLSARLEMFVEQHRLGEVLEAPTDVVLSQFDVIQPDILFISHERSAILGEKNVQGAPDLLVEILSESSRKLDEITKRKLYEQHGVREYWVVDPVLETVKVYRQDEGETFVRVAELTAEARDVLETLLLPGLAISLADLFA
jgi:Uma2 family endonuclease